MSFTDMMSSGRGPGMIGLLMAALVLAGFGALYVFVFDAEAQGRGVTIESVIRDQSIEIEAYNARIAKQKELLAEAPRLKAAQTRLADLRREKTAAMQTAAALKAELEKTKAATSGLAKAWEDYREKYRVSARGKAVGEQLDELKTRSGAVYKKVEIRDVTAVGVQIRHEDGQKRIGFEDLSDEWQDRFQFDPDQKAEELAKEAADRKQHEEAVDLATESFKKTSVEEQKRQMDTLLAQTRKMLDAKEVEAARLKTELGSLQSALARAEADFADTRGSGRTSMKETGPLKSRILAKQTELSNVLREIAGLKAKMRDL